MTPLLGLFLSTLACFVGTATLALSQRRPRERLWPAPGTRPPHPALRPLGWALVGIAAVPAVDGHGLGFGLTLWLTLLPLAGYTIAILLAVAGGRGPGRVVRAP